MLVDSDDLTYEEVAARVAYKRAVLEGQINPHPACTNTELLAAITAAAKSRATGAVAEHRRMILQPLVKKQPDLWPSTLEAVEEAAQVLVAVLVEAAPGATPTQMADWLREHTAGHLREAVTPNVFILARAAHNMYVGNDSTSPKVAPESADGDDWEPDVVGAEAASDGRPQIKISTELHEMVDQAEAALLPTGTMFARAGYLVTVGRGSPSVDPLVRASLPRGALQIKELSLVSIRERIGKAARFLKYSEKKDAWEKGSVPKDVAEVLFARGEWRFQFLSGITSTPLMRADGTILAVRGYDPATQLIYEPEHVVYPTIPESPTRQHAQAAYALLADLFSEFPFVSPHGSAAAVSLILTILARNAIVGCTPVFGVEASVAGTGKTLLTDICSLVATGSETSKMQYADKEEEQRKEFLALALGAPQVVNIDNVDGDFGTGVIASVVTAGKVTGRMLGRTEMLDIDMRAVICYSGNNVTLVNTLQRRCNQIKLDAGAERPELRTFRRDVRKYVIENRPTLVMAALTVLRAYHVAGRPAHGKARWGSFEAWDDLIRGAVVWASGVDPYDATAQTNSAHDEELINLSVLLNAWRDLYGDTPMLIGPAMRQIHGNCASKLEQALADALTTYGVGDDSRAGGYLLKKLAGRITGGWKFARISESRHGVMWGVVSATPS